VIGAGIGGLTTAAVLAKAGFPVTVLEAHIYPGGCAGTFYHQSYRFDAGATLAGGFYPGGPMDLVAERAGVEKWPAHHSEPAMAVHLPSGRVVTRWGDERRHAEHAEAFGQHGLNFFRWQEYTADAMWALALRTPPWPPQDLRELTKLVQQGVTWLVRHTKPSVLATLLPDAFRTVSAHLPRHEDLTQFVDAQLLISAQTTSQYANALYGASALDLPRRGVVHLEGGMGSIAAALAAAVRQAGGKVIMRQEVTKIHQRSGAPAVVCTKRGDSYEADIIVANLTPWSLAKLLGDSAPRRLRNLPEPSASGWGAFMVYAGIDESAVPSGFPLHHQIIRRRPYGEGNTAFISISPDWDRTRAPAGKRAVTISTHTALTPWWQLYESNSERYEQQKELYTERLLDAASQVIPSLSSSLDQSVDAQHNLVLPGTPVTFQRFTRRSRGWVGGFPQTALWRTWSPRLAESLWLVGDTIFPGQSTAAVALGGLRVADAVMASIGLAKHDTGSENLPLVQQSAGD
jgi:C-3',4' desaturase CrtD